MFRRCESSIQCTSYMILYGISCAIDKDVFIPPAAFVEFPAVAALPVVFWLNALSSDRVYNPS